MVLYNVNQHNSNSQLSGFYCGLNNSNCKEKQKRPPVKLMHNINSTRTNCTVKYGDNLLCEKVIDLQNSNNNEFSNLTLDQLVTYQRALNNGEITKDCFKKNKNVDYCKCIKQEKKNCKKLHLTEHFSIPQINIPYYDEHKINIKISIVIVFLLVLIFSYLFKKKIFV